jgi:hypothetical protein
MSKFAKTMKKLYGSKGNVVAFDPGDEYIVDFCSVFTNVFAVKSSSQLRLKNLIYRSDTTELNKLPEIKIVFSSEAALKNNQDMINLLKMFRCDLVISSGNKLEEKTFVDLASASYAVIEYKKSLQIWRPR